MALFRKVKYFAIIFDDDGYYVKTIKINKSSKTFKDKINRYNIDILNGSYSVEKRLFFDRKYYYYNQNDPNPLRIDKKSIPILSPELYNIELETHVARQLNNFGRNKLLALLTPRNLIILGIIIVVGVFFLKGGKLI